MEDTYNLTAIVLSRRSFNEDDDRVVIYSEERGKQDLVVRGARKIKSKLAGHLEPFNLVDLMVARGKQYDYASAAVSENCFAGIKNNLEKLTSAGQAIKVFDKLIKPGVADKKIFFILVEYLQVLNLAKISYILTTSLILKLLNRLGYKPELIKCVSCRKKIEPLGNKFDFAKGGVICQNCGNKTGERYQPQISADAIKVLRLIGEEDFKKVAKIKISKKLEIETANIINKFLNYHFDKI